VAVPWILFGAQDCYRPLPGKAKQASETQLEAVRSRNQIVAHVAICIVEGRICRPTPQLPAQEEVLHADA
jgi:hypothetical protein